MIKTITILSRYIIIITACLATVSPAWADCPLISLTPCKATVHHVKKVKPTHRALAARVADLERRVRLAEAALAVQQHQLHAHKAKIDANKEKAKDGR